MNEIDRIEQVMKELEFLRFENAALKERIGYYEGKHIVARQIWHRDDVAAQLELRGFEPSDENIDIVISEARVTDVLSDCTTGNEMIEFCIYDVQEKLKVAPLKLGNKTIIIELD